MVRGLVVLALLEGAACSDPPEVPVDARQPDAALPTALPLLLSEAGLYSDFPGRQLVDGTRSFAPNSVLWSDGAIKERWIQLPSDAEIDSTDMDHWLFPVGTKWFKQFSRDGKRLETRLIWRVADTGDRERDTLFGSYVWNDTETEATFAKDGAVDVRGTDHDVPSAATCWRCHIGEEGRALGFSALQLGDVSQLPLSRPPPAGTTFAAPDPALGYLHANCGHCHNPNGGAWASSSMVLRLDVAETTASATQIVQTTVGVDIQQWLGHGYTKRIVAGDPTNSALWFRMTQRTVNVQMPPIVTEHPDPAGVELLRTWIQSQ
ncbi:hypothetical protein BH11MYX3_BH11MYX3_14910 [soil metagenome]